MQRTVFERSVVEGFRISRVESLVSTSQGKKIFAATADGAITAYTGTLESNSAGRIYACKDPDMFRKPSKDKKSVAPLQIVEAWRCVVCIAEGVLTTYDTQFHTLRHVLNDNRGINLFAICDQPPQDMFIVVNKKKMSQYLFQSDGFQLQRDFNLSDLPKTLHYLTPQVVVVGYRKHYEVWDLFTGQSYRLLEIEKEHRNNVLLLPSLPPLALSSSASPPSVPHYLFTLGAHGLILDLEQITSGNYFNPTQLAAGRRIEWSAPPHSLHSMPPLLLSTTTDQAVEVHDVVNFIPLQKISLAPAHSNSLPLSLSVCVEEKVGVVGPGGLLYHVWVCNGEQLMVLRMLPLSVQINTMVSHGQFEEAISFFTLCPSSPDKKDIDVHKLQESCAHAVLSKGDFEKAVYHFVQAETSFLVVARYFVDFVPLPLQVMWGMNQTKKLTGSSLERAARAVISLCEHHRPKIMKRAERAERVREVGIIAANSLLNRAGGEIEDDEEYISDPDEELRKAVLLDSMLCFAYMSLNPPAKAPLLSLLSQPNRCQLESCSVLLASHGNAYTEALLWLFRSQHQHSRVLQALTEEKCVAMGAWSRDQFYQWTADYLRSLWYQEEDAALPRQALQALKPVLEYDAELGLSVLVNRPPNKTSFGGKGVTIGEVLSFLRSAAPKINYSRGSVFQRSHHNTLRASIVSPTPLDRSITGVLSSLPLLNGLALCVAFLECLVSSGEAPGGLHDDLAQLLIEGILSAPHASDPAHSQTIEIKGDDAEDILLPKIYRRKLQVFLMNSPHYHPQKIMKNLPREYLIENALVLGKLGRHREVLEIYIQSLKRPDLAEVYCDKIYTAMKSADSNSGSAGGSTKSANAKNSNALANIVPVTIASNVPSTLPSPAEIYLIFFQVVLDEDDGNHKTSKPSERVTFAISLAEKYFDRFDATAFLELLPDNISIASLSHYLKIVLEYGNSKKRNLQILHHLLRVREVAVRTPDFVFVPPASK